MKTGSSVEHSDYEALERSRDELRAALVQMHFYFHVGHTPTDQFEQELRLSVERLLEKHNV